MEHIMGDAAAGIDADGLPLLATGNARTWAGAGNRVRSVLSARNKLSDGPDPARSHVLS